MRESVVVASGVADDASLIAGLIRDSFREYEGRLVPASAAMLETAGSIAHELGEGGLAFIARVGGVGVGCVVARPKGRDLYFGRLSVVASFRGKGIGARLVAAVEDAARVGGFDGVVLAVRIALVENQRFFSELGYVEVSRSAHAGCSKVTSIEMRKAIAPETSPARASQSVTSPPLSTSRSSTPPNSPPAPRSHRTERD